MPQRRPLGPQRYDEFKQKVRRYRPSDLLPALARRSAEFELNKLGVLRAVSGSRHARPFMLAGVAQASVLWGNEFRNEAKIGPEDLDALLEIYFNSDDPAMHEAPGENHLSSLITRHLYEQAAYQESPIDSMTRMLRILDTHSQAVAKAPSLDEWRTHLGVELADFAKVSVGLHQALMSMSGTVAASDFSRPEIAGLFSPLTPAEVSAVVDKFFVNDPRGHQNWYRALPNKIQQKLKGHKYDRWAPHALQAAPLVRVGDKLISPMCRYVLDRAGSSGLYFIGLGAWNRRFTDALGPMFEKYVREQLDLLGPNATVLGEIEYEPSTYTVDFFIITAEVLILVEVKANRPIWEAKIGHEEGVEDFEKKIGHARDQITKTSDLIDAKHPELAHLPAHLPRRGLIVTLEPFYAIQTAAYDRTFSGHTPVPTAISTAGEIEQVCPTLANRTDAGSRLLEALTPRVPDGLGRLSDAIKDLSVIDNHIMAGEWQRVDRKNRSVD